MEISPIAMVFAAGLLLLGYCLRAPILVALFGSLAFGSTAIAILPAVGGATVLLSIPLAGLLIASTTFRSSFWRDLNNVFALNWMAATMTALLAYAMLSAVIFPRLFAGQTTVFVPSQGAVVETVLMPVSGNLNQVGYFCVGILTFFAVSVLLLRQDRFRSVKAGFLTFAILHSVLGLIDLIGKSAGAPHILSPLRTAGYTMLVDVQVDGFWRIVGGYSEASTFGAGSLIALAFAFSYWRATGSGPMLLLWSVLLLLLVLSTSTTAYAGLAVLLLIFGLSWLWRLSTGQLSGRDMAILVAAGVGFATVLGILLFGDGRLDLAARLVETTLLEKSTSASAGERFYWNQKSWMAFLDTYGLGVGLGSSRASSSFIAILSQLGIAGCLLFSLIFFEFAKRPVRTPPELADAELAALCGALRSAGGAIIIAGALSSGGADPGILFYIIAAGLLVGRARLSESSIGRRRREGQADLLHRSGRALKPRRAAGIAENVAVSGQASLVHPVTRAPASLSEADWVEVLPVFQSCLPRRGGRAQDDRKFLEALLHSASHGLTWRALPKEFGNWNSIWKRYWRLSRAGVFKAFFDSLAATRRTAHLAPLFKSAATRGDPSSA
jgi:transposase